MNLTDKDRELAIAFAGPEPFEPLIPFKVEVIAGAHVVRSFEAMAADSCSVVVQHADLVEPSQKMSVMRLETWRALQLQADRAQAAELARDPLGGYTS